MATPTRDELLEALTGFRLSVRNHRGYQEAGEIAHPETVADALHATLSRIAAEHSPDLGAVPSGPASSALDEIKERAKAVSDELAQLVDAAIDAGMAQVSAEVSRPAILARIASSFDVPRLVAAIERALEKADDWERKADEADGRAEAASQRGDHGASLMLSGRGQALHDCSFALREAITRELAKGETGPCRD